MGKYECKICNYITKNKTNHIKHCNTKKHLEKVIENTEINDIQNYQNESHPSPTQVPTKSHSNICQYCNNNFSRPDGLAKHMKSCFNKLQKEHALEDKIKTLNAKLLQSQTENKHYKKETEHYKAETKHQQAETDYYKQLLREAGGLVKKSVSSLTFIVDNYNGAPPLQMLSIKNIDFNGTEKKIVENILSAYKHKTIGKYLGDYIVKIYKKSDPKDQSIWNTDDNRLTYIIKELMHNNSSNWIVDKKGLKTKEYLINPLLTHIKELLISYQSNLVIPNLGHNSIELEFMLENSKIIIELMNSIDDGGVSRDILRHISTHLKFNTKSIE